MKILGVEGRRKAVHIGMAGFAFFLPVLGWRGSAAAAALALAFNLLFLPWIAGRSLSRESDAGRRVPIGIVLYPVTVLSLILLFRNHLEIAAAGWGFLAFGDGLATLVGRAAESAPLPWNPRKSVAGTAAYVLWGGAGATVLYRFASGRPLEVSEVWAIAFAALVGAGLESLPSEVDDNLLPPVGAALTLALVLGALHPAAAFPPQWPRQLLLAVVLNTALPLLAVGLKVVRVSGAVAGGISGALILAFGGFGAYGLLWAFFAIGTVATWLGRKRKEAIGRAEGSGGRRGAENVIANVAVPVLLVLAGKVAGSPGFVAACRVAAAAAFATAAMDTVGTEVGQVVQGRTFLLPEFREVPPGTDGAVSLAGTAAGLLAADLIAILVVVLYGLPWGAGVIVVAAACVGTIVESLLGRDGVPWRVSNGHVLNLYNTAVGASVAWLLAREWAR